MCEKDGGNARVLCGEGANASGSSRSINLEWCSFTVMWKMRKEKDVARTT